MFFPRGGFAVDIEALEDLGVPSEEAKVRVLGLGSLEYAVLATGALVCAVLLLLARGANTQRAVTLSWVIGVPARDGTRPDRRPLPEMDLPRPARGKVVGPPLSRSTIVGQIVASPRRHGAAAFSGMALYWAGEVFVLWVCLAAFTGQTPSVAAVVVGYATGYALTRRTLPLGGAGAVEALMPFALVWVGYGLRARRPSRLRLPHLQPLAAARSGGRRALGGCGVACPGGRRAR